MRPFTAEDFLRAAGSVEYNRADQAGKDAAVVELVRVCAEDERSLLEELAALDLKPTSVYDFVNVCSAPASAYPILVAHLDKPHHPRIWEGLVRALSVREARDAALWTLTRLYVTEESAQREWLLANAMGAMATFSEVAALPGIEDYRYLFRTPEPSTDSLREDPR